MKHQHRGSFVGLRVELYLPSFLESLVPLYLNILEISSGFLFVELLLSLFEYAICVVSVCNQCLNESIYFSPFGLLLYVLDVFVATHSPSYGIQRCLK